MRPWKLDRANRYDLIHELLRWLDWYDKNSTETLQDFLGIPLTGWLYWLREGPHGQSDEGLRKILRHISKNQDARI